MNTLTLLKCALADLQGIMPEVEPSGDRTHSGWQTITDLEKKISELESGKKYKVRVAWNREAVELMNEVGWEKILPASEAGEREDGCDFGDYYFNTYSEAEAFMQGIEMTTGYQQPESELFEPTK